MDGLPPVVIDHSEDGLSGARGVIKAIVMSAGIWAVAALATVYALWI